MADDDALTLTEAVNLDEEELFEALGAWLLGSGPGFGPSDAERTTRFASAWLENQLDDLRRALCGDVLANLKGGGFDLLTDGAAVADTIAATLGRPPANLVAVILLRRGIHRLCE
jgi:hypothetical protein